MDGLYFSFILRIGIGFVLGLTMAVTVTMTLAPVLALVVPNSNSVGVIVDEGKRRLFGTVHVTVDAGIRKPLQSLLQIPAFSLSTHQIQIQSCEGSDGGVEFVGEPEVV